MKPIIKPGWPAPIGVMACTTLRTGGYSQAPWSSWNLADHVGDDPDHVRQNRRNLTESLRLPDEPVWLKQVHGIGVITIDGDKPAMNSVADGSYTRVPGKVCVVQTADCLPVLITSRQGTEVAAIHAGWRGLANGVLESGLKKFRCAADDLTVWLGPAIGPERFEVGEEVKAAFMKKDPMAGKAFKKTTENKYQADLYQLARQRLKLSGVSRVYGGGYCTHSDQERFFSYRRDGQTGRMASLIWIE